MRVATNIFACALTLLSGAAFAAPGSKQPFSLTLHPPPGPVKVGGELRLRVTVTNNSNGDIRFARSPGIVPQEELSYHIEVRDAHGRPAPITPFFRHLKDNPGSMWGSYLSYTLGPGKSFEDELLVTKLYTLAEPGKYTVWVARSQEPWPKLTKDSVRSGSITVNVTE